jgi:methanogenic corrinoid protein MtbC1
MKKSMSIISETFENEKTGESIEGVTIMIDGVFKEVIDIVRSNNQEYDSNVDIIADALMRGMEAIRDKAKWTT